MKRLDYSRASGGGAFLAGRGELSQLLYINVIAHLLSNLKFIIKRSRTICAMTGLNIQTLAPWEECARRTGEEFVGCQSNVQHDANFLKRTYSPIHLFTHSLKKRAAFTLAEVLITLGIIGIVAAMTLPVIISNIKAQQLRTAFLKGYSVITQAFELYNNDSNCTTTDCLAYGMNFANAMRPYFKEVAYCSRAEHNNEYCFPISTTDTKYWNFSKKTKGIASNFFDDGQFLTPDGMLITFEQQQLGNQSIFIGIDTNGRNKMPNVLGQDLFLFQVVDKGGRGFIVPVGGDDTDYPSDEYCNFESASRENGYGCAARALSEPDFFKNLK